MKDRIAGRKGQEGLVRVKAKAWRIAEGQRTERLVLWDGMEIGKEGILWRVLALYLHYGLRSGS